MFLLVQATLSRSASTPPNLQNSLLRNGGADSLEVSASAVNVTVRGGSGNDTIRVGFGAGFNQQVYGDAGTDSIDALLHQQPLFTVVTVPILSTSPLLHPLPTAMQVMTPST